MKWLSSQVLRSALGPSIRKVSSPKVISLGRKQPSLKRHNVRLLLIRRRLRRLRMNQSSVHRLCIQVTINRRALDRLPPIPHHGSQKPQVGSRQRPPIHSRLLWSRLRAVIRILNVLHRKICGSRHSQRDPYQTFFKQQAISRLLLLEGRNIRARTIRPIHGSENWVPPASK